MAVKFHLVQRKDLSKNAAPDAKKYFAQAYATGKCDLEALCETVADRSTATAGDVKLVLDGFMHVLRQRLLAGEIVSIGELGSFQAIIGSKGADSKEEFTTDLVKTRRIMFRPGKILTTVKNTFRLVQTSAPRNGDEGQEPEGGL